MKTLCLLGIGLLLSMTRGALAQKPVPLVPELRVYKPGFATGEDIEFHLGLKGAGEAQVRRLQQAGTNAILRIEEPNGKTRLCPVDLRTSGLGDHYLLGYNRLTKDAVLPGRYRFTFQVGSQHSPTVALTVGAVPMLAKIRTTLRLAPADNFPDSLGTSFLLLTVQNDTDTVLRLPRLQGMEGLSVQIRGMDGPWEGHTFDTGWSLPRTKDGLRSADEFTWAAAAVLPITTLKPGEKLDRKIALQPLLESYLAAYKTELPVPPGRYQVTLTQSLNVLLGERHDPLAVYFPVRLPLHAEAVFTATSLK